MPPPASVDGWPSLLACRTQSPPQAQACELPEGLELDGAIGRSTTTVRHIRQVGELRLEEGLGGGCAAVAEGSPERLVQRSPGVAGGVFHGRVVRTGAPDEGYGSLQEEGQRHRRLWCLGGEGIRGSAREARRSTVKAPQQ